MTPSWAENLLRTCLCLRPGERLAVLAVEALANAGQELCRVAGEMGAGAAELSVVKAGAGPLRVVSTRLLREVSQADVVVTLWQGLDPLREHPVLRASEAAFRAAGRGRWAIGAAIDETALARELTADYTQVAEAAQRIGSQLAGGMQVEITTPLGTDLRLTLGNRPLHLETGMLLEPGAVANLPAGEVYVAPLEESAEGRLVVDLAMGDLPLPQPVAFTLHRGRVVEATSLGSETATVGLLEERLGSDPWAWTVGELGVGANAFVRTQGATAIVEKALGTVHIALGANRSFGGINGAATHCDCVIGSPAVSVDGRLLKLK